MSNVFLKTELNDIFDTITESNDSLPGWVTVVDVANKTSKSITVDKNNYSVTSSAVNNQVGGMFSDTSATNVNDNSSTSSINNMSGDFYKTAKLNKALGGEFSATSDISKNMLDGEFSATSDNSNRSAKINNVSGGDFSATSDNSNRSANLNNMLGGAFSATSDNSNRSANLNNMLGGEFSATSDNSNRSANLNNMLGGAFSATSDNASAKMNNMLGGAFSATSDNASAKMNNMLGGEFSATSANSTHDVNKLISMLTSESSTNDKGGTETSTETLENQLREILKQGGGKNNKSLKGGNENKLSVDDVKIFFKNLKVGEKNVNVKINDQNMSDFFNSNHEIDNTTTDIGSIIGGSETSQDHEQIANIQYSATSVTEQNGGGKNISNKSSKNKKKDNNSSNKVKNSNKSNEIEGGAANEGFLAFLDLKKHIAEKLGISNNSRAAKLASIVQKDMKEQKPTASSVVLSTEGKELFNKKIEHYKKLLPSETESKIKLKSKSSKKSKSD
jgi:hypothetical protein